MSAYHSALRHGRREYAAACERVEFRDGSVAFVANLADGLAAEYERCDVMYADAPFPAGLKEFERRAGTPAVAWTRLLNALVVGALRLDVPLVFSATTREVKGCPEPDGRWMGRLNGGVVDFWCYGVSVKATDASDVIRELAVGHECIGDPLCGYGRSGRLFREAGKRFVMSDINATCIGYIAEYGGSWPIGQGT
jgi:hypothetical protein